jgi:hypothetical protein
VKKLLLLLTEVVHLKSVGKMQQQQIEMQRVITRPANADTAAISSLTIWTKVCEKKE